MRIVTGGSTPKREEDAVVIGPVTEAEAYDGDYFVVPKVAEQTVLDTTNKYLSENVTVEKIPMYEAANSEGGNTLSIGEMYYVS